MAWALSCPSRLYFGVASLLAPQSALQGPGLSRTFPQAVVNLSGLPSPLPKSSLLLLSTAPSRRWQPREGALPGSQDGCSHRVFPETQCSRRQARILRVFHRDSEFLVFLEEDHGMGSARAVGSQPPPGFFPALPMTLSSPLPSCCMQWRRDALKEGNGGHIPCGETVLTAGPSEGSEACPRGHCYRCGWGRGPEGNAVATEHMACVAVAVRWEGRMESEVAPASWEAEHTSGQPLVKGRDVTAPLSCDLAPPAVSFLSGSPQPPAFVLGISHRLQGLWADRQASPCQDRGLRHGHLDPRSLGRETEAQRGVDTQTHTHTLSLSLKVTLGAADWACGLPHLMSEPTSDSLTSQGGMKSMGEEQACTSAP